MFSKNGKETRFVLSFRAVCIRTQKKKKKKKDVLQSSNTDIEWNWCYNFEISSRKTNSHSGYCDDFSISFPLGDAFIAGNTIR